MPNALSNSTIPNPLCAPVFQDWGSVSYRLLSQEQVELRTSNLGDIFTWPFRIEAHKEILEKMERGRIQGLPKFLGYPLFSQEGEKLRTSNFVGTFIGSIGAKAHEKFWE